MVIAVDPGHGGRDPGAIGRYGTREKGITLAIGKDLAALINARKAMHVVLTRTGDYYVGLRQRVTIARRAGACLFVSIHADAGKPSWNWATVYTQKSHGATGQASDRLADDITRHLRLIERTDRDRQANFVVLRYSRIPAVLVEVGYVTNVLQARQLLEKTNQRKIAGAIYRGIRNYLGRTRLAARR
ncbi:MAG: N-acetylmuramoyl-L-alanine amidase [Phycisphaerae bacterium]|nr:N-acetylmuramoyl-L-alanine amidase [Phycisphaerae bacterium]